MTNSIDIRIETLAIESAEHGDLDMADLCDCAAGCVLVDSRTGEIVTPEELFGDELPMPAYVRAIVIALDPESEGYWFHGRLLYAA